MSLKQNLLNENALNQVAGITGIGWTAAMLAYLSAMFGFGNDLLARFLADPRLLLYLGGVLFATTVVLDWLRSARVDGSE